MTRIKSLRILLLAVAVSLGTATAYGVEYTSKKLEHIAALLSQSRKRIDTVQHVNEYGEIEHLGLRLFSNEIRQQLSSPVCDFLERYLLELNISSGEDLTRLFLSNDVTFVVGNHTTALSLDTLCGFTNEQIDYYRYRSTWTRDGKEVLKVVFPMSWKLLSGCTLSELETRLERCLLRHKVKNVTPLPVKGTYIIYPVINNDLYLEGGEEEDGKRKYIFSSKQRSQSVVNLMLAEDLPVDVTLRVIVDRYDYITDTLSVPLHTFQNFCVTQEGCKAYFGLKGRVEHASLGLLLFVNEQGGFLHMLSVSIGDEVLEEGTGVIEGRLMPYVPLHNVKKEYLNFSEYETIR